MHNDIAEVLFSKEDIIMVIGTQDDIYRFTNK